MEASKIGNTTRSMVLVCSAFLVGLNVAFAADEYSIRINDYFVNHESAKRSETELSISAYLESDVRLRIFTSALKSSDVWRHLKATNATLFVITDAALRTQGSAFLLQIVLPKKENAERMHKLMAYHFVPTETVSIAELSQRDHLSSLGAGCIPISAAGGSIQIGPEAFVTETISAKNGSIYFIDRLLWQPYQGHDHCTG